MLVTMYYGIIIVAILVYTRSLGEGCTPLGLMHARWVLPLGIVGSIIFIISPLPTSSPQAMWAN